MDGVSFGPVSSSSLQRKEGNQICHCCSPLACYGNKASHVCVCVCAAASPGNKECSGEKEMRGCLSTGYTFTSSNCRVKYTDPIERSHGNHKNSTLHPVNISTTLIMFTCMEISLQNTIFHPGSESTRWLSAASWKNSAHLRPLNMENWKPYTAGADDWSNADSNVVCWRKKKLLSPIFVAI